ncbi:MAG TPA: serine/threonine-protein kinase, partial [Armatimonadota bacterium]|nr:serine/threonine-protein kinase [Armatimonadota bacterium]
MESTNTLGKYQIIREIARSNDIVYEATDPTLGRRVALKELYFPPNIDGAQKRERIERFMREGKAAARLEHPNIVTVYEIGQEGDRFFIAMEFLGGQTLRDTIKARGALPVKDAVDITLQLCEALALAHQNNIVHRDVKPENVQILPGGHVKLTDFGIARIMSEPSITANGQVFGTPSYMSPEQVSGRNIDGRSDIFSLGVLLYEMLTGQKPFAGDTVVTITYNIMNSEPPPPPGVQPHLVAIIRKAMAKDPNMRFQSVEEMADALELPYEDFNEQ